MNVSEDRGEIKNKEQDHISERAEEDGEKKIPYDDAEKVHGLLPQADDTESHHDRFDGKKYEENFAEGDPLDCCMCVTCDSCCTCIRETNKARLKYVMGYFFNLIVYLASVGFIYLDLGLDIYYMVTFLHRRGYVVALGLSASFMALSMLVTAVVNNHIAFDTGEIVDLPSQNSRWARAKHICKRLGYLFLDFPLPQLHIGYTLLIQSSHKIKLLCMALSCCQNKEQLEKNLTDIHNWNQQASRGLSARPTTAYSTDRLIEGTGPQEKYNGGSQQGESNVSKKSNNEDGEKKDLKDLKEDAERGQSEGLDVSSTTYNRVEMSIACDFYIARIKLLESLLEAAPQLLINLFIMVHYHDNIEAIQIAVSVVAFLSFVWGIVHFERQTKTIGCYEHTKRFRAPNRMEISQTCMVFLYKALLLGARFLSLVYFTSTFTVAILAVVIPHFFLSLIWLTYNRVYFGVFNLWDESVSMKEKWQHFLMIIINSVLNIFLYFHDMYPTWESSSILLHADMVIYYLFFTLETIMMVLFPLERNRHITDRHYYLIMAAVLLGLVLGLVLMLIYYSCVHKSKMIVRHRYFGIFYRNKDKQKVIPYRDYHTKNIKMIARGDVERGVDLAMGDMYRETYRYFECRRKGMCVISTPEGVYKMVPRAAVRE